MNYIIIIICSIILPIFSLRPFESKSKRYKAGEHNDCAKPIKPKLCINCKYFITDNHSGEFGKCSLFTRKIFESYNYDFLVNGINKDETKDYLYCSIVRAASDKCGIEGKMHIRKYEKKLHCK